MNSEGVSSGSRRSAGGVGGRSERSSSSTQGVFMPNGADEDRDGVAPKCRCEVYAVLYMFKTANNPNMLFFDCPFFKKARWPHCKFFLWLDRHTEQLGKIGAIAYAEETEDGDKHLAMIEVENRVVGLENRVAAIERKIKPNLWAIVGLFFWVVSVYVVGVRV
ncbi:hypothetical protein PIB30_050436 [Stylosanthes scabra]|uniref:Zinc finger GRF-type domain-containing protein n=1 Tax=Stylosanthes scabra TaxID=79078 RepID=A0ABU6QHH5_9FABA|nr:hypothetical protein [Stylosanthes scabra]